MSLIKVTQIERNGVAINSELMLIDTRDIVEPMYENLSGQTIIKIRESIVDERQPEAVNKVQYVVDENLATVLGLSTDLFPALVLTRNGKAPVVGLTSLGFSAKKVVGAIRAEGVGSKFFYHEDGDVLPVEFVVDEDINTIEASL